MSRGCGSSGAKVSKDEAIAAARQELDFKPKCVQVRFFRKGIQSRPYWAVSLWTLTKQGRFGRVTLVIVDAGTGKVTQVNRQPALGSTPPQCAVPV